MSSRIRIDGIIATLLVIISVTISASLTIAAEESAVKYNDLTPDEERVLIHKGTEVPFSGEYYVHNEDGTYTCKRCDAPLYRSTDKFDAGCGWPSFDDEIPGAIKRVPEAELPWSEIVCANCGGHLGHVFVGEGFTPRNTRHCVNSVSLNFVAAGEPMEQEVKTEKAFFAGGCFWGVEYHLEKIDGVLAARSGYMGGQVEKPSYEEVCSGNTGHAEAVEVEFDPSKTDYETLARLFFEIHDPTQRDRQGPDHGSQYRSAVFYVDENQKAIAEKLIGILKDKGLKVATELAPADTFWPAETYHQDYYDQTAKQPYFHAYTKRF
jgi:peptide methionine sulfoxide reductase msrA/msrB